ncbi:hypothetical protein PASE110613_15400 [Paenibacillus sediminis]|uniref:Uncharacterized protein n=1 Tax=Paenibacillus sediminis TaxID=664909 RepID=A0ABS4H6R0_9BACL|nr:hypothetical protein [Paenibacillus sediminis]MBP1938224.1 hypothetical protein [Paenibacillus sediminis]
MKLTEMKIVTLEYSETEETWLLEIEFNLQHLEQTYVAEFILSRDNPQSYLWKGFRFKDKTLEHDHKAKEHLKQLTDYDFDSVLEQMMSYPKINLDKLYWQLVTARESEVKWTLAEDLETV